MAISCMWCDLAHRCAPAALSKRVVLVMGSAAPEAAIAAAALASKGACLLLHTSQANASFSQGAVRNLLQSAKGFPVCSEQRQTAFSHLELAKSDAMLELSDLAEREFGNGIDILVNVAASSNVDSLQHALSEDLVLPSMRKQGWGRIINILPLAGLPPVEQQVPAPSRSRVLHERMEVYRRAVSQTEQASREAAKHGATCNTLLAGLEAAPLAIAQREALAACRAFALGAGAPAARGQPETRVGASGQRGTHTLHAAGGPPPLSAAAQSGGAAEPVGSLAAFLASDEAACFSGLGLPALAVPDIAQASANASDGAL